MFNKKEWARAYHLKYYPEHKEQIRAYQKEHAEKILEYTKEYQITHAEEEKKRKKLYRLVHADKVKEYQRQYDLSHVEKIARRNKEWIAKNREQKNILNAGRRAAELYAPGRGFTYDNWVELLNKYGNHCLACGSKDRLSVDHVVPLFRGGSHDPNNIQPLCRSCNSKKGAKIIEYRPDRLITMIGG